LAISDKKKGKKAVRTPSTWGFLERGGGSRGKLNSVGAGSSARRDRNLRKAAVQNSASKRCAEKKGPSIKCVRRKTEGKGTLGMGQWVEGPYKLVSSALVRKKFLSRAKPKEGARL